MKRLLSFFALSAIVLGMASCGGNDPVNQIVVNPNSENGMMPGKFTVDEQGTQVRFSQGNLQFNANLGKNGTWRFATNQWDTVGATANALIASPEASWIDLFGWNTALDPTKYRADYTDYQGDFEDWGKKNAIANGGNNVGQWRTPSSDEWRYIFCRRNNAQKLFGLGSVNGINGVILLPDNWDMPSGVPEFQPSAENGLIFLASGEYYYNSASDANNFADNTYSAAQWDSMEKAGAVFLPAAGYRQSTSVSYMGSMGYYWSSTPNGAALADYTTIRWNSVDPKSYNSRNFGNSVRLVR